MGTAMQAYKHSNALQSCVVLLCWVRLSTTSLLNTQTRSCTHDCAQPHDLKPCTEHLILCP